MTNKQLLFALQNLSEKGPIYTVENDEETIIDYICLYILMEENYEIDSKIREQILNLLNTDNINNTILAANLILKLKLEEQHLR